MNYFLAVFITASLTSLLTMAATYLKARSVYKDKLFASEKLLQEKDAELAKMQKSADQQQQKVADLQYQLNEAKKDIAAARR